MKAIVMAGSGDPEVLAVADVRAPIPRDGEILVQTEAIPVLFVETQIRSGRFPMPQGPAGTFGTQAAGVIVDVGPGVDSLVVGRRVIIAGNAIGTYAEFVCAPLAAATAIPDTLRAADAAAVVMGGSVALALERRSAIAQTNTALVQAAGTGIGGYLTQLLSRRGVRVFASAGSQANRTRAAELGAETVFDHRSPQWTAELATRLGDDTIDVLFESIGGETVTRLLDTVTPGSGRILLYGMLSGLPSTFSSWELLNRGLTLVGCGGNAWLTQVASCRKAALDLAADGQLMPLIDSEMPLDAAADAHRRIETRETAGTIILRPPASA